MLHPSASISPNAYLGKNINIWHYSHVDDEASIGDYSSIGQGCYIGKNVSIGRGCRVSNCVGVFEGIQLEDLVFLGPFMSFTHIKAPRAFISRKKIFSKTLVRKGASIGANATILPALDIGSFAFVAAGAILTKSISDFSLWVGTPAKQIGWVDVFGHKLPAHIPGVTSSRYTCHISGDIYEYTEKKCIRTPSGKIEHILNCGKNWRRQDFCEVFDQD